MTHEEHLNFERNSCELTMVGQIPPLQAFVDGRFASGSNEVLEMVNWK